MSKRDRLIGIVVFTIALGWAGYYFWCSSGYKFPAALKQKAAAAVPVSSEEDCANVLKMMPNVQLLPKTLTVALVDLTSRSDAEHLNILAGPACQSLYGARQAATAAGEDTSWFNGLPFVLVDDIDGATDQAQFRRKIILPWDDGVPRLVLVASGTFAAYPKDGLVWTLGHELGHGVYGHSMKRKWLLAPSLMLIGAGMVLGWHYKARRTQRLVGAAFILAGVTFFPTSHALFSKYHEMDADIFGVDAAAHAGIGKARAKAVALKVLNEHSMNEDSWWYCGLPNLNVHPSTAERIKRIEKPESRT